MVELADQIPQDELALRYGALLLSASSLFPAGREGMLISGPRLLKGFSPQHQGACPVFFEHEAPGGSL